MPRDDSVGTDANGTAARTDGEPTTAESIDGKSTGGEPADGETEHGS